MTTDPTPAPVPSAPPLCESCGGSGLQPFADGSMRYADYDTIPPAAPAEVLKVGWAAYYESDPWTVSEIEAAMNATYAAGMAAGRKQAAADLPAGYGEILAWLGRHGLGQGAGPGAVLAAVRADLLAEGETDA